MNSNIDPREVFNMFHIAFALSLAGNALRREDNIEGDEETQEKVDPEVKHALTNVYLNLFTNNHLKINASVVQEHLEEKWTLSQILAYPDVDHYNLLDKAIIYNDIAFIQMLLQRCSQDEADCLKDSFHLACFLGCEETVRLLLQHSNALLHQQGAVKLSVVVGPPGHKLKGMVIPSAASATFPGFRMQWVRKHYPEEPVYYAICGDQVEILRILLDADSCDTWLENSEHCARFLQVAAKNASYGCLAVLLTRLKGGIHVRDKFGCVALASGLCHGAKFVEFLVRFGANSTWFNNIEEQAQSNALHVFLTALSQEDVIYSKFSNLYKVTKLLLQYGVDVNQETNAYKSHDIKDTCMHMLLDSVNLIVGDGKQCARSYASEWDKLQATYDVSVLKAFRLILQADFDVSKHATSLLLRLFTNKNHLIRFKLYARYTYLNGLKFQCYGLAIVYHIAETLCQRAGSVVYKRRQMTPLLALVDSLVTDAAFLPMLDSSETHGSMMACMKLLLDAGVDPNTYPLSPGSESFLAPVLIHFIDTTLRHHSNAHNLKHALFNANGVDNYMSVINLLCERGAKFTCHMNIAGTYVKHGIFDVILPFVFSAAASEGSMSPDYPRYVAAFSRRLITTLLLWGAEPKVYDFVYVLTRLQGIPNIKQNLLFQVLVYLSNHRDLSALEDFDELLQVLFNITEQGEAHSCLTNAFSYAKSLELQNGTVESVNTLHRTLGNGEEDGEDDDEDASSNPFLEYWSRVSEYCRISQSLKHTCRRVIRRTLRRSYIRDVRQLPVPPSVANFLLELY